MGDTTERAKDAGRDAGRTAKNAGRSAIHTADSPWVKALGEWGVASIGIVYLLLAWITVQVAFGSSNQSADNSGALKQLADNAFGRVLLAIMALGLAAYVVWQVVEAAIGFHRYDEKKRLGKRLAAGGKAVIGLALGIQSAKLALGGGSKDSGQTQSDWTAKLLSAPAGQVLVVIVGLAVIAFAGYQIYEGATKKFLEKIEGSSSQSVVRLGQAGFIARGVAFGILGILVVVAGVKSQPDKSTGMDGALKTLAGQPYGVFLLVVIALGLAAYGAFQLVTCRSRREG